MSDGANDNEHPLKRRDFLKLVGLTTAATAGAGCLEFPPPPEKLYPYVTPPENVIPGIATYYASTCRECPAGCGLHVKTREGRPIKLEGNPNHPVNRGTLCGRGQAALQGVYNPDRWTGPQARQADGTFKKITWDEAQKLLDDKLVARSGAVQFWTGQEYGTRGALYDAFARLAPNAQRVVHEAFSWEAVREGNRLSFGRAEIPTYDFEAATTVFTFGADFLETWISPVEYMRKFAASHGAESSRGRMVAFEPRMSLTGTNSDEWVAIKPGTEALAALAMAQVIVARGMARGAAGMDLAKYAPEAVADAVGVSADVLTRLAVEFASNGPALAVAGGVAAQGSSATQAVVAANVLTAVAGGLGKTIRFDRTFNFGVTHSPRELAASVDAMKAGSVAVLLVVDTDPAYSLPAPMGFRDAMAKVPFKVSFSPYPTDTAMLCDLILPDHHPLESWGDHCSWSGVLSLIQPTIRPVFDTKSTPDVLLAAAAAMQVKPALPASWYEHLKATWIGGGYDWEVALQNGGRFAEAQSGAASPSMSSGVGSLDYQAAVLAGDASGTPIVVYASPNLYDGRGANKPWLQETPDPVTKVVWDHWIEMHPNTAKKLGMKRGEHVSVKTAGGTIETAVYDNMGMREDVFAMGTGQGHRAFGRYAKARGANVMDALPLTYDAASGAFAYLSTRGSVTKTGKKYKLSWLGGDPYTGGQSRQLGRDIALAIPLAEVGKPKSEEEKHEEAMHEPGFKGSPVPGDPVAHAAKEAPNSAYAKHAEHKWGMVVDLNACTGCQACVVACSMENNVSFVGKEQITRGREMMWLRIERFYEEHEGGLEVRHVPVMCQHCGAAPCESVCPVYATYHNPEGLNAMIYNRCVGTRYCGNNCPYKVRAFNWFAYQFPTPLNWQLNPDVTVRDKGVMEKCTFCIQRIRDAKDRARDEARKVKDGDVRTACQQTCPAQAIRFGDLMDEESEVRKQVENERGYKILGDINTYPSVTYLKKVTRRMPA